MYADPTLMDLAAAYAKRRNGRKTKHAVACDRPGAKAKMGLLDRLGAAASALAGPGKDPTTQEYKTSVAEAKKAAIDEVKNYAFMVKQNDQKLAALDAYVKSTSKAIATLNSAPEILRLTDGLRQAVKARSVLLQTLKMPFGRKARFAATTAFELEVDRLLEKKDKISDAIIKDLGGALIDLRDIDRIAKKTPLAADVKALMKVVDEAMETQRGQYYEVPREPAEGPDAAFVATLLKYVEGKEKQRTSALDLAKKAKALARQVAAAKPTKAARASKKSSMARMDDATRRELRLFISRYVSNVKPADAERLMTAMYEKDPQHWEDQGFGKLAIAALGRNFSRPGAKSTHAALPPQTLEAERKPGGGSHSEAVSRKIATLINEGKPQDQAVAIAIDLERRGEL